ncbi:uncharacterized protein LOC136771464 [Amia ocellicauda]|uniref:uncharacterized protein LOC136771464 n=1 Tax=Amia ocellicauda TaxID=2972642 RepID=UPI003463B283
MLLYLSLLLNFILVSSDPVSVSVRSGDSVTLPCDGSAYRGTPEDQIYIKWQTVNQRVYEFVYGKSYPGPGFEDRAEIPMERIRQGDFSLTVDNTSSSDGEIYECFCERKGSQLQFLGNVRLTIAGREESSSVSYGQPLSLRLYSRASVRVRFNPAGAGASLPVCAVDCGTVTPDPAYGPRVSGQEQEVTLSALTFTDQGSYTVLDSQSRETISTVNVTVTAHRDALTLPSGASLSLPLYSPGPVEVLFFGKGGESSLSVSSVENITLFSPGPGYEHRVSVQNGSLTLPLLTAADQGQYTVRDSGTNLTISTVSVSLTDTLSMEEPGLFIWTWVACVALILTLMIMAVCVIHRLGPKRKPKAGISSISSKLLISTKLPAV